MAAAEVGAATVAKPPSARSAACAVAGHGSDSAS